MSQFSKKTLLAIVLGIFLYWPCPGLSQAKMTAIELQQAHEAWKRIVPTINIYWKEVEERPFAAKKTAWQIIDLLKRFIVDYPQAKEVPEAYYIIGSAYKQVGFIPEAISHWRIVAKEFPDSKWADEALLQILLYYDETGKINKKHTFLKEIIRQYPDTTAAKAAWVALALDSLKKKKNVDFIEREVRRLEAADPNVFVKVPMYLELKARLASLKGDEKSAIDYWMHFLNLTVSREKQAAVLFEIGEAYRRLGDLLKARKYYALCARDYSKFSYALFSRFRLAQIRERERKITPWSRYKGYRDESSAMIYDRILRQFPKHSITQEVEFEYALLKFERGDLPGALKLVKRFFKNSPNGALREQFLELSKKIRARMIAEKNSTRLRENLTACLSVLNDRALKNVMPGFDDTAKAVWKKIIEDLTRKGVYDQALLETKKLLEKFPSYKDGRRMWQRIIQSLNEKGDYVAAIKEAKAFKDRFPRDEGVKRFSNSLRKEALNSYFKKLLKDERPLVVLDFFYSKGDLFNDILDRNHLVSVGMAWNELGCPDEAGLFMGKAFFSRGNTPTDYDLLLKWAEASLETGDFNGLGQIISYLDRFPQGKTDPRYLHLKVLYEQNKGNWDQAYNLSSQGLSNSKKSNERKLLLQDFIKSSVHLGLWDVARDAFRELDPLLNDSERRSLMSQWADTAFDMGAYEEAFLFYNLLLELDPKQPDVQAKMALCLLRQEKLDSASGVLRALSTEEGSLWGDSAKAILGNEEFWKKVPSTIKNDLKRGAQGK
ncbi:tetratricopeptide repeat protein [Dissulfuribacter thermophilus]|uniref:tetratricopeptide repeat protein n=1 Tax=Dissulfuribacter thermophilus TaxID=1156395 RepID=UPI00137A1427|nr:tetratricopeptide repeat protein [Dissulfuribacter thermophilus]